MENSVEDEDGGKLTFNLDMTVDDFLDSPLGKPCMFVSLLYRRALRRRSLRFMGGGIRTFSIFLL